MADQEVLELYAAVKVREWELDPIAFFEDAVSIKTVNGRAPFTLRKEQREALQAFLAHDRVIVLKARQIGFSTLVACYSLWLALFKDDQTIDLFADKQDNAVKLLAKVKYAYNSLPDWVKSLVPVTVKDTELKMSFSNGSSIEAFPATSDAGRGETATLAVLDEWAAYGETAEKAWSAIEPTIDIGGKFIGLSTAQGMENYFHTKWQAAGDPASGFVRIFFPWSAVPERDDQWYARKKAQFDAEGTPWILHQEYPTDPETAFLQSGMSVFDTERLRHWRCKPPLARGKLKAGLLFEEDAGGNLQVWAWPNANCDYAIGADVAEGLPHGDFSDATVYLGTDHKRDGQLVLPRGAVVARLRGKIDPDLFGDELDRLGRFYGTALIGAERNSHGISTVNRLNQLHYPRIYKTRTLDHQYNEETVRLGWLTTKVSKPLVIDGLAAAIRQGEISFWDEQLRHELLTYARDDHGRLGRQGVRDDAVMSAAIGWHMLSRIFEPEYRKETLVPYMSLKWWEQQLMGGEQQEPWL